jgi:hypothetical protein
MRISLRHAAALALVSWYLLLPPYKLVYQGSQSRADPGAPLERWLFYNESRNPNSEVRTNAKAFDSNAACEATKEQLYPADPPPIPTGVGAEIRDRIEELIEYASHAICVSSNDPRLNSN